MGGVVSCGVKSILKLHLSKSIVTDGKTTQSKVEGIDRKKHLSKSKKSFKNYSSKSIAFSIVSVNCTLAGASGRVDTLCGHALYIEHQKEYKVCWSWMMTPDAGLKSTPSTSKPSEEDAQPHDDDDLPEMTCSEGGKMVNQKKLFPLRWPSG